MSKIKDIKSGLEIVNETIESGKALKKPLNKLSSSKWKISGPVEDPKTEFLEWFE